MINSALLTIAHNLFLTKEERYVLGKDSIMLDTVGICLPVWVSGLAASEPGEEVYCLYRLRNHLPDGEDAVSVRHDGFLISITEADLWRSLLDAEDGGCGSIYLTHQGKLRNNDAEVLVIHYINIQDISVLVKENNAIR